MGQLPDIREETFCVHYAGGASMAEAARRAGFSSGSNNAGSRLARRLDVKARIAELSAVPAAGSPEHWEVAAERFISKPWVVQEVVSTYQRSTKIKEFGTALACLRTLSEIGGHIGFGARSQVRNVNTVNNIHMLDRGQLDELLRRELGTLPERERAKVLRDSPGLARVIDAVPVEQAQDPTFSE